MTDLPIKTTYGSKQKSHCRLHFGGFSLFLSCLPLSLSSLSLSLLFPWKLTSRWRGWRGSGGQTRTSGPVWPCMEYGQTGPVGKLGSLYYELTKLIRLQSELFMFCLFNPPQTEQTEWYQNLFQTPNVLRYCFNILSLIHQYSYLFSSGLIKNYRLRDASDAKNAVF